MNEQEEAEYIIGDGCLFVGNTVTGENGITYKLPDFKTENGVLILLDTIEAEVELILRGLK